MPRNQVVNIPGISSLLPQNVLYVNQQANGYAVWYTPPQEVNLFFVDGLHIPSGKFHVPAMLWKANAERLAVYALKGKAKPTENTKLCHAPYLNIYAGGQVCMGTVQINIAKSTCLEEFMQTWERYFLTAISAIPLTAITAPNPIPPICGVPLQERVSSSRRTN
ncbi:hypothetical protein [Mucilaginibacter antarcticus]|uniref:hypothetical protein n=1 Tax=Mucilaginibacter antarcticus TaxID=1855725 RepID=UPI0036363158